MCRSNSRAAVKKDVVAASNYAEWMSKEKGESLEQRAVVQHVDSRQGENRKMASCCTLLRRITRLKNVNSEIRSRIQIPTWKGIPRRVHATMTNPAWVTHLLRTIFANSEVEFILHAKSTPIIPDRNGSVKRPEKVSKSTIAIASARCKELEADTSVQLSQIVPTMTNCDHSAVMKRHEMKRLAGSGLSRWPWRYQKEMKLNENGSKPWTPGDHNLAGTHGWSVRASWDACKELRCAELCKSPLPPCCKYGKEVKQHPQKHMKSKGRQLRENQTVRKKNNVR